MKLKVFYHRLLVLHRITGNIIFVLLPVFLGFTFVSCKLHMVSFAFDLLDIAEIHVVWLSFYMQNEVLCMTEDGIVLFSCHSF